MTGSPDADTVSLKRINPSTVESSYKKGGKVTLVNTRTVAADGKTMTVTVRGTKPRGRRSITCSSTKRDRISALATVTPKRKPL